MFYSLFQLSHKIQAFFYFFAFFYDPLERHNPLDDKFFFFLFN